MNRLSSLLLGIFLVLLVAVDRGQAADPIREKLDKAKTTFDEGMKKAQVEAKKEFDDREAKARKVGKKELVDKILEERKAFEETGALTDNASPKLRKMVTAQRTAIEAAYDEAIKKYTMQKKDDLATAVVKEKEELQNKAVVLGAKVIPHQKAAEALHPHVVLGVQPAFGNTKYVKMTEPLPAGGFVITQILLPEPLPPTFVDDILLPSLTEIHTITDLGGRLTLSEDQFIRLGGLPIAKSVTSLDAQFDLTPRSVDILKQMSNLTVLSGCSAKTANDALLARLGELRRLRYLRIHSLELREGLTKAGLEKLAGLPLVSLAFNSSTTDRDFVRSLPQISTLGDIQFIYGTINDEDMKDLVVRCPKLYRICLVGTKGITDGVIGHLGKCQGLTTLEFDSTPITDAALEQIPKVLKALKKIDLRRTAVTDAGVKKLAAARPDLTILVDSGTIEPKKK